MKRGYFTAHQMIALSLIFIPFAVFSVMGFVAFLRPVPATPVFQEPLIAGNGIILDDDGTISVNQTEEMLGEASATAEIYAIANISAPLVITISSVSNGTSNMVEVIGPTILNEGARNFVQPSDSRMQYVGNRTVYCHVAATISISCVSTNQVFSLMLGKNGTLLQNTIQLQSTSNGGDIQATALHGYVKLQPYEYLSLFVGNIISASNFVIYAANGFAMCMDLDMVSMKK